MLVTQLDLMKPDFAGALEAALIGGARLIQLRENSSEKAGVLQLAQNAKELCDATGAQLLINADAELATQVHASGVHLRESQSVAQAREILGAEYSIGQSVHSLASARRAQNEGADYVVFGSVFPTASHPGSTPAGCEALREVTSAIGIPVFAIGGVSAQNAHGCREAGAHGVAVIRAVWDANDVVAATRALLKAIE